MKTMWAPWRINYLTEAHAASMPSGRKNTRRACVFCAAYRRTDDPESLVLARGKLTYVILNRYPYANGHLMVIPNRHVADFTALTRGEHTELGLLMAKALKALKIYGHCDGFNIGMNLGESAGAGIKDHLHYHVVPRWRGDHNFMPVLADTRVIPEHLLETAEKLREVFSRLRG